MTPDLQTQAPRPGTEAAEDPKVHAHLCIGRGYARQARGTEAANGSCKNAWVTQL